jgi:hypothetical protein
VFATELDAAGPHRDALRDGLVVACSWATWNLLRGLERRSYDEAAAAVAATVTIVLRGAGADLPRPGVDR